MRRLIAVAVLLIFVVSAYLIGFFNIKSVYKQTNVLVDECVTAFEEDEDVNKKIEKLENFWDKKEKLLSVFSNHALKDEIELAIYSLGIHSKTGDSVMFYEYSGKVKTLLHQLKEDTVPSVHSIL